MSITKSVAAIIRNQMARNDSGEVRSIELELIADEIERLPEATAMIHCEVTTSIRGPKGSYVDVLRHEVMPFLPVKGMTMIFGNDELEVKRLEWRAASGHVEVHVGWGIEYESDEESHDCWSRYLPHCLSNGWSFKRAFVNGEFIKTLESYNALLPALSRG